METVQVFFFRSNYTSRKRECQYHPHSSGMISVVFLLVDIYSYVPDQAYFCFSQGISVFTAPGLVIDITPPHVHMHVPGLFSAGILPISIIGEPGAHGAGITGTHGTDVSTPRAAAVTAATAGFDGVVHIPNGGMFAIGLLSMMFAAGMFSIITLLTGNTTRDEGATPKLHCIIAPIITCFAIARNSLKGGCYFCESRN